MKTCVFSGPTLWRDTVPPHVSRYGPAVLGSVYRAVESGYRRIGLVDGFFGNVPAVWHKEILYALAAGAEVSGAASMGALRAAELSEFGMIGVGAIYRMFRLGAWTDDDEVATVHAPAELHFKPLSQAMADIRFTLRALRRKGLIEVPAEQEMVRRMKAIHFSDRTSDEMRRQSMDVFGRVRGTRTMQAFETYFVDAKHRDALALLRRLAHPSSGRATSCGNGFHSTRHWRTQFIRQLEDVPPLH